MICFKKGSLFCCAVSSDVSVSDFSTRSLGDAVSAGASAAVEELATSPSTKRTSSISAVAAEDAIRSVSFLGGTVIGVDATWFEWGSFCGMSIGISACRLDLVSAFPCSGLLCMSEERLRRAGGRMVVVSCLNGGQPLLVF